MDVRTFGSLSGALLAIFRKSLMSVICPPAILELEMSAPILWAPGIFLIILLENPQAHKIPPFSGVLDFFGRGGGGANLF